MKQVGEQTGGFSVRRATALLLTMAVILGLFSVRLFYVQIVQGDYYSSLVDSNTKTTISIAASRGEILDRNQMPLVSNRTSYAITIDYNFFPHGSDEDRMKAGNDCLLSLIDLLQVQGEEWNDILPISLTQPYEFTGESGVDRMKKYLNMAGYATAQNCMDRLIESFSLLEYEPDQQRRIAGVRYNMMVAGFGATTPYTFASDISDTTMYKLMENSRQFPGIDVITVAVREYVGAETACHVIGSVGPIYAEEYADLKDKGYSFNDVLGKSGIEAAAESYLRGTAGKRVLIKNSSGTVLSEENSVSPIPGKTVILSMDSRIQQVAQQALDETILDYRKTAAEGKGRDIKSGAVVMLDVKTGGVMVCASWPDYDLSTYTANYEELLNDPDNPLFNRALYGAFPCGSSFKPGLALAALTEGKISPRTIINCTKTYMYYAPSYTPNCLGKHGPINVVTALQKSCNYFFYEVGRLMNDATFSYLSLYGFGQRTGVEIGESAGLQQTPEYLKSVGQTWVPGDYLQLAIGQRGSYTPIQLAAYAMMIANNGVRYKTHFIQSIRSFDGSDTMTIEPEIAATVEWSQDAMKTVHEGMVAVAKSGTAAKYFTNISYTLACKTGTAQTGLSNASDHGTFIAYAPADNPEVALAVVTERGTSSSAGKVARKVLDAYFAGKESGEAPTESNVLLP